MRGNRLPLVKNELIPGSIPACAGEPFGQEPIPPGFEVYPRVCGGTTGIRPALNVLTGLSPRVRGNLPDELAGVELGDGSIPACAGEPDMFGRFHAVLTVYPRVCGGTCPNALTGRSPYGLSPRVRGNLPRRVSQLRRQRSIPACAGEPSLWRKDGVAVKVYPRVCGGTKADVNKRLQSRVYPRVCGGTLRSRYGKWVEYGLSPRVRGNRELNHRFQVLPRSIPACAGEPSRKRGSTCCVRVYPRVCGGTVFKASTYPAGVGLSPRVRGNRRLLTDTLHPLGSIPACAGEPGRHETYQQSETVYPRVCGGTIMPSRPLPLWGGLSPRVRGNRFIHAAQRSAAGSIPACAGEPFVCTSSHVRTRVYPRVCGGTIARWRFLAWLRGLSPRVRGNPDCVGDHYLLWGGLSPRVRGNPGTVVDCRGDGRSIPACAGEPHRNLPRLPALTVYPRVCGGTGEIDFERMAQMGLSPRVRGNRT